MKIIKGCSRIVFVTSKYAFKFPNPFYKGKIRWGNLVSGVYCNLSEKAHWKICKNIEKGKELCPVKFSFAGILLIMPRVHILTGEEKYLLDFMKPAEDGEDRKPENYGVYQNRLVCVDYPYHRIFPFT
ncbi:MAG: hypothetical protein WD876_03735 [Candidatus Pacearchaeota archaeon]